MCVCYLCIYLAFPLLCCRFNGVSYLQALNFTWPEENLCVYEVNLRNLALVCGRDLGLDLTALVIFHVFFFQSFRPFKRLRILASTRS